MTRLVQIVNKDSRRVGVVDGSQLRLLPKAIPTAYHAANTAAHQEVALVSFVENAIDADVVDYDAAYAGDSEWRILPSFDHPDDPAHCLVSGTGLTHKASAKNRAAMHTQTEADLTDSYRMFQLGLEGGNPKAGIIGVQPEWFYKGNGLVLRGHRDFLTVPGFGEDGGEEPEIVGVYLISPAGEPLRVGFTVGNEFSDHKMEKRNYLYLAPSKLRECSIGPELIIGPVTFENLEGRVSVSRNNQCLWSAPIWSGSANMAHSVANLEHHHFKYPGHRVPGEAHIHFFGADAFSFGAGVVLEAGDLMEVSFPEFGRPLQNLVRVEAPVTAAVTVRQL